jgi:hypothetical protein
MKKQTEDEKCDYECVVGLCGKPVYSNLAKCVLHAELPRDKVEAQRLKEKKREEFARKKDDDDFDFEGAIIFDAFFSDKKNIEDANFVKTIFVGSTLFEGVTFKRVAEFDQAIFRGDDVDKDYQNVSFEGATFEGEARFPHADFELPVRFQATFKDYADFLRANFRKEAWFAGATFANGANFYDATFEEKLLPFRPTDINGGVSFKETTFLEPSAQQAACRTAKQVWEALGERDKSDKCFYKEMEAKRELKKRELKQLRNAFYKEIEAKRKQKKGESKQLRNATHINKSDLVQKHISYTITCVAETCFGYGVKPARLIRPWLLVFVFFGLLYWLSYGFYYHTIFTLNTLFDGLSESLIFSFGTSIVPGYGLSSIQAWTPPLAVGIETVSASLILAGFIVVFTRKYAR